MAETGQCALDTAQPSPGPGKKGETEAGLAAQRAGNHPSHTPCSDHGPPTRSARESRGRPGGPAQRAMGITACPQGLPLPSQVPDPLPGGGQCGLEGAGPPALECPMSGTIHLAPPMGPRPYHMATPLHFGPSTPTYCPRSNHSTAHCLVQTLSGSAHVLPGPAQILP